MSDLRSEFRFRINYRPVTDQGDFRVKLQEDELDMVRAAAAAQVQESMNDLLRAPLQRLREVVERLYDVTGKPDRQVQTDKGIDVRPPIFRDSVVENISEEISLLHAFAEMLPDSHLNVAKAVADALPHPQKLRDDPAARTATRDTMGDLLRQLDNMLEV